MSLAFLKMVLPEAGPYALYARNLKSKSFVHTLWFDTVEQLWDGIDVAKMNADVWFSSCSFNQAPVPGVRVERGGTNVKAKRCLWLDLDHYPSRQDAMKAVCAFAKSLKLPYPGFISSGHGVHCYWPFSRDVLLSEWKPLAAGLRVLAKKHNLLADHAVTADPARGGRCPETTNYKSAPVPVEFLGNFAGIISGQGGPWPPERFAILLDSVPVRLGEAVPSGVAEDVSGAILPQVLMDEEEVRKVHAALESIPNGPDDGQDYDTWFKIGAAVSELGWGETGRRLFQHWSRKHPSHDSVIFDRTWNGYFKYRAGRAKDERINPGTLFAIAGQFGWRPPERLLPPPQRVEGPSLSTGALPGTASMPGYGEYALRIEAAGYVRTGTGLIAQNNYVNTRLAIHLLGIRGRHDDWRGRDEVLMPGGKWEEYQDRHCMLARSLVIDLLDRIDPGLKTVREALDGLCGAFSYNSLRDRFRSLQWDGVERLDTWPMTYCGAEDTQLNREVASLPLIAAARRVMSDVFVPWKYMLVLEGAQNTGKSSICRILGLGPKYDGGYFTDAPIDFRDARSSKDVFAGTLIYEWAELDGHNKTSDSRIKSLLSSPEDRARDAYAHISGGNIRRALLIGTCNPQGEYLKDHSGGCRYLPLRLGDSRYDLSGFEAVAEQLWAEALHRELKEPTFVEIPDRTRKELLAVQLDRTELPRLYDTLTPLNGGLDGVTAGEEIFSKRRRGQFIGTGAIKEKWLPNEPRSAWLDKEIRQAMLRLGWEAWTVQRDGTCTRGYFKGEGDKNAANRDLGL